MAEHTDLRQVMGVGKTKKFCLQKKKHFDRKKNNLIAKIISLIEKLNSLFQNKIV